MDRRTAEIIDTSWQYTIAEKTSYVDVLFESPILDISGYANIARNLVQGYERIGNDIAVCPRWFKGAPEVYQTQVDEDVHRYLKLKDGEGKYYYFYLYLDQQQVEQIVPNIRKPYEKKHYIIQMAPYSRGIDHFKVSRDANRGFEVYIGSTMFETDRLPEQWVTACNNMDYVWVPTAFNLATFKQSGVRPDKLIKIPLGVNTDICTPGAYVDEKSLSKNFTFLSVFEWNMRKGWDVLVKSYCRAFSKKDPVELIIKTFSGKTTDIQNDLATLFFEEKIDSMDMPKITVIDRKTDMHSLYALYDMCDCFVLPTRGEGWGMPFLEAMAFKKPVIGTNWGGNTEFMNESNSFLIEVEKEEFVSAKQLKENICFTKGHKYANPSSEHLIALMREVFQMPAEVERVAEQACLDARQRWSHIQYAKNVQSALEKCA